MYKVLVTIFFFSCLLQITNAQQNTNEYHLYTDILIEIKGYSGIEDSLLMLDSTTFTKLELTNLDEYLSKGNREYFDKKTKYYPNKNILKKLFEDKELLTLLKKHNQINEYRQKLKKQFDEGINVLFISNNETKNWEEFYKNYPEMNGYNALSYPSIIENRAVFMITSIQSGYAGECVLFICERINEKWTIKETLTVWGT